MSLVRLAVAVLNWVYLLCSATFGGLLQRHAVVLAVVIDHVCDCSHVQRFGVLARCKQAVGTNVKVRLSGRLLLLLALLSPQRLHIGRRLPALRARYDFRLRIDCVANVVVDVCDCRTLWLLEGTVLSEGSLVVRNSFLRGSGFSREKGRVSALCAILFVGEVECN